MEGEALIFEKARPEDFEEAMGFFAKVIEHTFEKNQLGHLTETICEEIEHKRALLTEALETQGEKVFFIFGKYRGNIVASVGLSPAGSLIQQCTEGNFSHLYEAGSVFVAPEFQGRRIGPYMVNLIQLELNRRCQSQFCFDSGYPSAQRIWTKLYGSAQFIANDFWGEGSPHMVWVLNVNYHSAKILPKLG